MAIYAAYLETSNFRITTSTTIVTPVSQRRRSVFTFRILILSILPHGTAVSLFISHLRNLLGSNSLEEIQRLSEPTFENSRMEVWVRRLEKLDQCDCIGSQCSSC